MADDPTDVLKEGALLPLGGDEIHSKSEVKVKVVFI